MNNLPPGSYLVDVTNPNYLFEPIRVDITSRGKMRARKVNYIQTASVQQLSYPLRFRPSTPFKYFPSRENWKITDFLFNPMVLMMLLPLLLIMVIPKMINVEDPANQKVGNQKDCGSTTIFEARPCCEPTQQSMINLFLSFHLTSRPAGAAKPADAEVRHSRGVRDDYLALLRLERVGQRR